MPIVNRVLRAMRPEAQAFLAERMTIRELVMGEILYRANHPFEHTIFPHRGIISVLAEQEDGYSVEKVSIGEEGFTGFTALLGGNMALGHAVVQIGGYASFIRIQDLDEALNNFACVRKVLLLYSRALIGQLMELVACNSLHSATQRVSRWLLHADERMEGSEFLLTQETLSHILGLRRATVSTVCSQLLKSGAIRYSRGTISVLDRQLLRSFSCQCHDRIVAINPPRIPNGKCEAAPAQCAPRQNEPSGPLTNRPGS
ncbi:Crp/Fnr family transcriptional regulator [Breoghania sp.]|uniref:Crp/Fnr family transcriptional regulator n=1 Tax=Breoghania sp. TaxID=2065378 RepID=UPI002AA72465|nr:Crp/Fnr family transcriptional regulator [Breoghania sp.]